MIREKALFCKLFCDKKSSKERFDEYMEAYRPEQETCPCCKCKGNCRPHAHYYRYIIDFRKGHPCCVRICVLRVMCSCGHTHAILPDFIVPYCQLSLKCLVQLLYAYYVRREPVSATCQRFGVEPALLYRVKDLYEDHKRVWLGSLADAATTQLAFLRSLCLMPDLSGFLHGFYQLTSISFLQSHRNPTANCDGCGLG